MVVDHSKTYVDGRLTNHGHRVRLAAIRSAISGIDLPPRPEYSDVGCSNGFITALIATQIGAGRTTGYDKSEAQVAAARAAHPDLSFELLNLNAAVTDLAPADLVTCFETLEHVGELETSVRTLLRMAKPSARILITVPIEIGPIGIAKYLVKRLKGYSLKEIGVSDWRYFLDLVTWRNISRHRPRRGGFSTHFGFDYREIDRVLKTTDVTYRSWIAGTTRFYLIQR